MGNTSYGKKTLVSNRQHKKDRDDNPTSTV